MTRYSLSKITTAVVYKLVALTLVLLGASKSQATAFAAPARTSVPHAAASGAAPPSSASAAERAVALCREKESEITRSLSAFQSACGTGVSERACVSKVKECNALEKMVAKRLHEAPSDEASCQDLENLTCDSKRALSQAEYVSEMEEARARRFEAADARGDSVSNMQQTMSQGRKDMTELMKQAMQAEQDYAKKMKELKDEMRKELENIDSKKAEALAAAQNQEMELVKQEIEIRDNVRKAQSEVDQLQNTWKLDCYVIADAAAKAVEAELDKWFAEYSKSARQRNVSARNMAGSKTRLMKRSKEKVKFTYNEELAKCLRGAGEQGTKYKLALQKAQRGLLDLQSNVADISAMIARQRAQIKEGLASLDASSQKKIQNLQQSQSEEIALLNQQRAMNMALIAKAQMDVQTDMGTAMGVNGDNFQAASLESEDAAQDELNAGNRLMCGIYHTAESRQAAAKLKPAFDMLQKVESACYDYPASCGERTRSMCAPFTGGSTGTTAPPSGTTGRAQ